MLILLHLAILQYIHASRTVDGVESGPVGLLAPHLNDDMMQKKTVALAQENDARYEGHHKASSWMSFSMLEICLAAGVVVALVIILSLVRKMQLNSGKIQTLETRVRGLQHSLMLDHQKAVTDEKELDALRSTLSKEGQFLEAQHDEIKAMDSLTRAQMDEVLGRGKLTVDLRRQTFAFKRPIEFVEFPIGSSLARQIRRSAAWQQGTGDPPPPEFADPQAAKEILGDLAVLMTFIKGAVLLIESHTSGGQAAMNDFGFVLAAERAELIVATLVELGIQKERLECRGCPGWLGDNRHDTKIVTLAWGY